MNTRSIWLAGLLSWLLVDYLMRIVIWAISASSAGVSIPLDAFPFAAFVTRDDWYLLPRWFCLIPPLILLVFFPRPQNNFSWRLGLLAGLCLTIVNCVLTMIWLGANHHSLASIGGQYWILRFCLLMPGPLAAGFLIGSIQKKVLA